MIRHKSIAALLFLWVVGLAIAANEAGAQSPVTFPSNSLRACWNLDESFGTRVESSTLSPSLSLVDINTVGSSAGVNGQAALFNEENTEYLSRSHHNRLSLGSSGGGDFAISVFVKFDGLVSMGGPDPAPSWFTTGDNTIMGKGPVESVQPGKEWALIANQYADPVGTRWRVKLMIYDAGGIEQVFISQSGPLEFGQWYHVLIDYDNAFNNLNIIINDTKITNYFYSGGFDYGTAAFRMGSLTISPLDLYNGSIDQAMIFKDSLDSNQRNYLYNNGSGQTCAGVLSGGPLPPPVAATPTPPPPTAPPPPPTPDTGNLIVLPSGQEAVFSWDISSGEIFIASLLMAIISILGWWTMRDFAQTAGRK